MATPRSARSPSVPTLATPRARTARQVRFEDIAPLRTRLPKYWWNEVSRVRAMIERDVEVGGQAAEHFQFVAEALATQSEADLAREHAVALWAASRQLSAIAKAQQTAAA
jgi:hypothetical protein